MRFMATADTDIGISRPSNQDSLLIKHATYSAGEVLLAAVCDGMGGLAGGELASATVVRAMSAWFDTELPAALSSGGMERIGRLWTSLLFRLNNRISDYGRSVGSSMGTTCSGMLLVNDAYVIVHVGDSRVYRVGQPMQQLTTDQSFIAQELRCGRMTPAQAASDPRKNLLLQCVGVTGTLEPELCTGKLEAGAYLLCSDGFWHELRERELYDAFKPKNLSNRKIMHRRTTELIELAKVRREKDNISAILVKVG